MADEKKTEDYNRLACTFCPDKFKCDTTVALYACDTCAAKVWCTKESSGGYCSDPDLELWKYLPRKCLLAYNAMMEDAWIRLPVGGPDIVLCPRCRQFKGLLTSEHAWKLRFGGDRNFETHSYKCEGCLLDLKTESP
jgi:hypothetical protein